MNIIRHDPWNLMTRLHRDLDRLMASGFAQSGDEDAVVSDWVPAVDIAENGEQFTIRADLPGVKPEDVEITMDQGVLSIQGSRSATREQEERGLRRVERVSGRFLRRFRLPESADSTDIRAVSNNGVLEIAIPKQPEVQPRRIVVQG